MIERLRPPGTDAPAMLQLAGHPVRWRLLEQLAQSDRMVSELTARTGEAQNLVSYHLRKLRDGGLVSAHRSSADRRDTYYGLDLDRFGRLLSQTGTALHPGLHLAPAARETQLTARLQLLFLCTGNSARSPMAAALACARAGDAMTACSAGSQPRPVHPNAVRVMHETYGLDLSTHTPTHIGAVESQRFDIVVTLCDRVREACPEPAGHADAIHWSLENPATGESDDITYPRFQRTAAELSNRIGYLFARLAAPFRIN